MRMAAAAAAKGEAGSARGRLLARSAIAAKADEAATAAGSKSGG